MSRAALVLGREIGPFEGKLDPTLIRDFALATKDPSPRVRDGDIVPPMAIVAQSWEAQQSSRAALIPLEFQKAATSGVHGQHDVVMHRPILPNQHLQTVVRGLGARAVGRNSLVTLYYKTVDAEDALLVEQWWTTVWLGVTCTDSGEPTPDHAFPEPARNRPIGSWTVEIDQAMARRYAQISGDWSPHHFDIDAAHRSGADGVFLHGLCTMALCAQAVVAIAAEDDPGRLRRVAVRFARPLLLGTLLEVHLYDAGPLGYAFEGTVQGMTVISNGRAELR